ncbi:CBS domain-containing protein, partial [Mesorhizobium sp. M0644]
HLLLDHNIRTLPVTDAEGGLVGVVGLREMTKATDTVRAVMSKASTASPDTPAMSLLPVLTDGRSHAAVIVDAERRIIGLITQTDLLAAAARVHMADTTLAAAQNSSAAQSGNPMGRRDSGIKCGLPPKTIPFYE